MVKVLASLAAGAAVAALSAPAHAEIRALVVAGPGGMTPSVMSEGSGIAPTSLSFHLKELMNAGMVTQERQGRNLVYRASFDHMNGLLAYLTENCCQGQGCVPTAAQACC